MGRGRRGRGGSADGRLTDRTVPSALGSPPIVHNSQQACEAGHYTAGNTWASRRVDLYVMTSMKAMSMLSAGSDHPRVISLHEQRKGGKAMVLFRQELGDVLRDARRKQGRTLRQVSSDARVSLGYLSEIERGQKEASSELLLSVTEALGLPLSFVLREVSDRIAVAEGVVVPDTVPDGLADDAGSLVGAR